MKLSLIVLTFLFGYVAADFDCAASYGIIPIGTTDVDPENHPECTVCEETRECVELVSGLPCGDSTDSPSGKPSATPSSKPSATPSNVPSNTPSATPSNKPSSSPSNAPSNKPSATPSTTPSAEPTGQGERSPSETPSEFPSSSPSKSPFTTKLDECPDKEVEICVAIDNSGSVCTKSGQNPQTCYPDSNNAKCDLDLNDKDRCTNFAMMKNFTSDIIEAVHAVGPNKYFSVLTFSDVSKTNFILDMTDDKDAALQEVADHDYQGGYTNTGGAIKLCRSSFTSADNEKVIILLTDGTPTTGTGESGTDCAGLTKYDYAYCEAAESWEAGILVLPMYIETVSLSEDKMSTFANQNNTELVTKVDEFDELPASLGDLLDKIGCDDDA